MQESAIMTRLTPLPREAAKEFEEAFRTTEQILGFVPNSMLIMARKPDMLAAVAALAGTIMNAPGTVSGGLKALVGHIASRSAGCQYCVAHTGHIATLRDVPAEKIEAIWDYESSPLFTEDERAALSFAQAAAAVPNLVNDDDFVEMRRYFTEEQIVEILGVVALYGFFNRWNDSLATELEGKPTDFGRKHLAASGWDPGKHAR